MKTTSKILANLAIAAAVLFALNYFKLLDFSAITLELTIQNADLILLAICVLIFVNSCAGIRWYIIARALRIDVKIGEVVGITHRAGMFIYFLPAQLAVDALRMAKFRQRSHDSRIGRLVYATILDKIIAFLSQGVLFVVIGSFFVFGKTIGLSVLSGLILVLLIFIAISRTPFVIRIASQEKWQGLFELGIHRFLILLLLSAALNLCVTGVVFISASIFSFNIPYVAITLSTLASNLATIIPITPNGLGLSEFVFDLTTKSIVSVETTGIAIAYIGFRVLNLCSYVIASFLIMVLTLGKRSPAIS